jgi:signal transduction histidine kinase
MLYAFGFAATHALARWWGGSGFYSLWYPAAGLRLALLWRAGTRLTGAVALVELGVDLATGAVVIESEDWAYPLIGAVRPVIAYGLVVAAVHRLITRQSGAALFTAPMPFALASVFAPLVAAVATLPQVFARPELTGVADAPAVVLSLSAFAIGDLLGVLLLAPPLLWITDWLATRDHAPFLLPSPALFGEATVAFALGLALAATLAWVGLGLQPATVLVAIAWVGLRLGRAGAWVAILVVAALVFPFTAGTMSTGMRLQLHLGLASIAVAGYLAGSFADAQAAARVALERRDRLLLQAERLKTLRAMSVAVIHEIAQPLSTLAIEARHLHQLTVGADPEIAATAALLDRKTAHLSELVRRLRRYGGRAVDEPTPSPVVALFESVVALTRPEASSAGIRVVVTLIDPDLVVLGQEVELAQAVVNLVRNAMQACGKVREVTMMAMRDGDMVVVSVVNRCAPDVSAQPGMGVGTLVARAIVEAHGGTLTRLVEADGMVRATIRLPLIGPLVGEPV